MESIVIDQDALGICQLLTLDQERVHYERTYRACRGVELRARASELEAECRRLGQMDEIDLDRMCELGDLACDMRRAALLRDGIWRH